MAEWQYRIASKSDGAGSGKYHPVTQTLLRARSYTEPETAERFLFPNYERDTHDPFLFTQMERVVERLGHERQAGRPVGVFGDYDADGVTASVIMREALTALGIPVVVYLPDKLSEGHGLNQNAIEYFIRSGARLALTLDCGMTNHVEINAAKDKGLDIIVIDHHHVPPVLPPAFAIINPKLPAETYPFRELCGAGTSFKVAQALYQRYAPERVDELKWLLDVVAIGTVADVMPLVGENRVFVKYGLIVLAKTRRLGLQELLAAGRIRIDAQVPLDTHTISFQIAPRLNAASRMAHAQLAHDLLMARDPREARNLASELDAHNTARRKISETNTQTVRTLAVEKFSDKKFIFAVEPHFPYGIVGLIAGRIANEFHKPTGVLTRGTLTSQGSFRSIPELSVIEALESCGDLLVKFGGHAQAAGMTISNENLDAFYARFNALVEERLSSVATVPRLCVDMRLEPVYITPELLRDLALFAPFGEGNPEPIFVLELLRVRRVRLVGNGSQHLKVQLSSADGHKSFEAIGFSLGERFSDLQKGDSLDVAFHLGENKWNGVSSVQLKLLDARRNEA